MTISTQTDVATASLRIVLVERSVARRLTLVPESAARGLGYI